MMNKEQFSIINEYYLNYYKLTSNGTVWISSDPSVILDVKSREVKILN